MSNGENNVYFPTSVPPALVVFLLYSMLQAAATAIASLSKAKSIKVLFLKKKKIKTWHVELKFKTQRSIFSFLEV